MFVDPRGYNVESVLATSAFILMREPSAVVAAPVARAVTAAAAAAEPAALEEPVAAAEPAALEEPAAADADGELGKRVRQPSPTPRQRKSQRNKS
jgi:hypothetical protein